MRYQTNGRRFAGRPSAGYIVVMDDPSSLEITPTLRVPLAELEYRASRSGGPGGQHVNTSSTRIEIWWDIARSPSLSEDQRALLIERLETRLDSAGRLRLVSAGSRSQLRNREDVTSRLRAVIADALKVRKKRKPTRPTKAAKAARLEAKRRRGSIKRERRRPDAHED
jgi:ribosome-associated protein